MAQAQGSAARFAYVPEVTWGTTPNTPSMKQLMAAVYGETLGADIAKLESKAIRATRGRTAVRGGDISVQGSVPFELAPLGCASLLKAVLGSNATTGSEAPYTHTIKRGAAPGSLTIEKGFTDLGKYFVFTGCQVDRMSLNINAEQDFVTGTMDIIAKAVSDATSALGSPSTAEHSPFTDFEAAIEEGGSPVTVLNMGLSFMNDLERVAAVGSRGPARINPGRGSCDVNLTLLFETMDLVDKWLDETQTSLEAVLTQGDHTMTFLLPQLKYFGDSIPKIQTDKGIVVELAGCAEYNASEGTDLKIVIENTEATI